MNMTDEEFAEELVKIEEERQRQGMSDFTGQTIHGYQLHELIGVGGVGAIYRQRMIPEGAIAII